MLTERTEIKLGKKCIGIHRSKELFFGASIHCCKRDITTFVLER